MMDRTSAPRTHLCRRAFLAEASTLATATISGCGAIQSDTNEDEDSRNSITSTAVREGAVQDDIAGVVKEIESLYTRLSALPIVEDNQFVFRVKAFENNFDQDQIFTDADEILHRLERRRSPDRDSRRIELLVASTELAKLLARQRAIVHQVIAAGLVSHRRISKGEYDRAANVIQNAERFVDALWRNIDRISETVIGTDWSGISIDEFDLESIRTSQIHLDDICRWTELAYEGIDRTLQGIQRFEAINAGLESKEYTDAAVAYEKSHADFKSAAETFDKAQGRGKRLPPLVPIVEGMRCLLPAYLESSRNLRKSMEAFEVGNRERARTIAREALVNADNKASRCF